MNTRQKRTELADEISRVAERYPEVSFAKLSRIAVHFAKWQAEQDTRDMYMSDNRHFEKVYELGKSDMKKQMLEEAVEAKVIESFNPVTTIGEPTMHGCTIIYEDENKPYLIAGDKVRIIIVKEDEK